MLLCQHTLQLGEKKKTTMVIGTEQIPLYLIAGAHPGNTLVITAGVHGCEYVGIESAFRFFEQIDTQQLHGQVILLPLINGQGFYQGVKQMVPADGKNLNRAFPGNHEGTLTEQIAAKIQQVIYPEADFILDLHGADHNESIVPLVFFPISASEEVNERCKAAAKYLPVAYRIGSTAKEGLYSYATQQGIPALLLEIGQQGRWSEEEVKLCLQSIQHLMAFLHMLPITVPAIEQQQSVQSIYEEAFVAGFWYPTIQAGQSIAKGQILGVLKNEQGQIMQVIEAQFDGIIWYYTTALGVLQADALVAYGRCY